MITGAPRIDELGGQTCRLEFGTVGWDGDGSNYLDIPNDGSGVYLVNVQLFSGRNPTTPIDSSRAQGYRIRAQLLGPVWCVPALNTRVLVAVPTGLGPTPGAAVILGVIGAAPSSGIDANGNAAVSSPGIQTLNIMGGSQFAALSNKVDTVVSNIITWLNTHTHGGVTTGPGATGVPSVTKTSEATTAAAQTKIT